jgi:Transposase DDE domain
MERTCKSPRKVTLEAFAVGQQTLPAYSHKCSPQKFTQPQLFAILALKIHQQQDYRGVVELLNDMPELVRELGLKSIPHYTTLQKAAERLLSFGPVQQLLSVTVERFRRDRARPIDLAAMDSTGMDTSRASRYFVKRRNCASKIEQTVAYSTFPKLELVCDCSSHLILCANATTGPTVDLNSFRFLLFAALGRASIGTILADAGYDTESNHRFARDGCQVRSVIPPLLGRPTDKLPSTPHRRTMKLYRDYRYGQRWQAETVMSMIKRNLSGFVAARSDATRNAEVMLKVLVHNIMLLAALLLWVFYRAGPVPLFGAANPPHFCAEG